MDPSFSTNLTSLVGIAVSIEIGRSEHVVGIVVVELWSCLHDKGCGGTGGMPR